MERTKIVEHGDGNRTTIRLDDHVNWRQWAATALPLLLTGVVGVIGIFRVLEGRVIVSEQSIIHMTQEIEDHRRRIASLENIVNRNDERMKQVVEQTAESRVELQTMRQQLARIVVAIERR
jgi:septal ring factor EnvC (AmiA/AmiB activator)